MTQTTCESCGKSKPATKFYLTDGAPSGECRSCVQWRARGLPPVIDTKICRGCEQILPLDDFYRNRNTESGRGFYCKPCTKRRVAAHRLANADELAARQRAAYRRDIEKSRAEGRRRYRARPHSARVSAWRAKGINLTWEQYEALRSSQQSRCAICERPESNKALAVDHDHVTGVIRGLLCDDCNLALGRFQDSPDVLRRALDYLGK